MTGFGLVFLPICLYFWRTPARLLELVVLGSVFAAAAVLVLGGFGVMPPLVPAAFFVVFFLFKMILGERYPAERIALTVLGPLVAVFIGAILSSLIMPRLFEGEAMVWPQKLAGLPTLAPLAPNSGNYTQDAYLLANAALTITASVYLTRPGFNLRRLLDAYFVSGLVAVGIAMWQFANSEAHVPYPSTFFLSNPGWALLSTQTMGSMVRLNGTFSEPSSLAGYLCGSVSAAAWVVFNGDKGRLPRMMLYSGLGTILLCTSATGYLTLTIMFGLLLARTVLGASAQIKKRVATGLAVGGVLAGLAVVTVPVVAPGVAKEAQLVLNSTLDKQSSSSYQDRTTSDADSMRAMYATDGLGVGWGSNRSSSLGPGLCAAVGVWGIFGLLVFVGGLFRHVSIAQRIAVNDPGPRLVMHGCSAGLLGVLVATLLSGPTISSADFYLLLALLIATAARVRHEASLAGVARSVRRVSRPGQASAAARGSATEAMKGGPPWTAST